MTSIEHKQALRRFHALCGQLGLTEDEKRALIAGERVESSLDIPTPRLHAICYELGRRADPRLAEMDKLRKRAMAAIGGWLTAAGYASGAAVIKRVACRASGYDDFNRIPAARLHNLYHNFRNKQIDKVAAEGLMRDIVAHHVELSGGGAKTSRPAAHFSLSTVAVN